MTRVNIRYWGMYDVPLVFVASYKGYVLLFDRPWDELMDDYSDSYNVYLLPELPNFKLEQSWMELVSPAIMRLADVPICEVQLDETRRRNIDSAILDRLLLECEKGSGKP